MTEEQMEKCARAVADFAIVLASVDPEYRLVVLEAVLQMADAINAKAKSCPKN